MKRKIVQINKLYAPEIGGIERVVQDIAEGLKDEKDIEMQVLVCQKSGKTLKERYNGVRLIRSGSFGTYFSMPISLKFFSYVRRLSKTTDVMCFHTPFPLGDLAYLLSGFKGKVIIWWHSDIVRQKAIMPFYKPIMNRFLKRADKIIVATKGHIESSPYLKPYKDKCEIIHYGIDEESFKASEDKEKILEKNTITGGKKILFVGRLVYYKGIEILVDAILKTKNTELFIIGEGPLNESLNEKIEKNNEQERIHFLGRLDDNKLKACIRDCDILAFPSIANSEAFGLVQLEAMIYGKPVINTNLPTGVPYVSIDGISGITVEVGNVDELAQAIQKLADNDELRECLGKGGYDRVKDKFDKKDMIEKIYNIFKEI